MTSETPTPTPTNPYADQEGGNMVGGPGYEHTNPPVTSTPTPEPTTTEAPYVPPVVNCGPNEVPGWLNEHGDPTSCVNNCPYPGQTAAECHAPVTPTPTPTASLPPLHTMPATITPSAPAAPVVTPSAAPAAPATTTVQPSQPMLADTGYDYMGSLVVVVAVLLALALGALCIARGVHLRRKAEDAALLAEDGEDVEKALARATLVASIREAAVKRGHVIVDPACRYYDDAEAEARTRHGMPHAPCRVCRDDIEEKAS